MDGCEREARANGLCRYHYDLVRRTGSAVKVALKRLCPECGNWFDMTRSDQKYCSARCRVHAMRHKDSLRAKGFKIVDFANKPKPKNDSKPAVKPVAELFTDLDVWEARGGVCADCGEPVPRACGMFSPDAMASAWRLPLGRGGEPTLANRVLLHDRCLKHWGCRHGGKRKKGQSGVG